MCNTNLSPFLVLKKQFGRDGKRDVAEKALDECHEAAIEVM